MKKMKCKKSIKTQRTSYYGIILFLFIASGPLLATGSLAEERILIMQIAVIINISIIVLIFAEAIGDIIHTKKSYSGKYKCIRCDGNVIPIGLECYRGCMKCKTIYKIYGNEYTIINYHIKKGYLMIWEQIEVEGKNVT